MTYFFILLLFFCHYWSPTVKLTLYFHCSLVILGFKKTDDYIYSPLGLGLILIVTLEVKALGKVMKSSKMS